MIYILHFDPPLHRARHYMGYTGFEDAEERLKRHLSGRGARIVAAAVAAGCKVEVTAVLPGDRNEERRLKRMGNTRRLCPLCRYLDRENGWAEKDRAR